MIIKQSTDITYDDIVLWKQGIEESAKLVYFKSNDTEKLRDQLSKRCADLEFLVTFVKSLLTISVNQEVYDDARDYKRELQDRMKSIEEEYDGINICRSSKEHCEHADAYGLCRGNWDCKYKQR
jgi:hypothetical protein